MPSWIFGATMPKQIEMPPVIAGLPYIHPSEVQEGDIVFCSRPGFLQRLCSSVGDLWRHVGMALLLDGPDGPIMGIVEVDGDRFVTRPLPQVQTGYDWLAIGRVRDGIDTSHAVSWARYLIGARQAYAWDDAVLAGFVALTRANVAESDPDLAGRMLRRASLAASPRWSDRRITHTCSSFVYFAYNSGDAQQRLEVDLTVTQEVARQVVNSQPVPALRAGRGSKIDSQQLREAARVILGAVGGGLAPDAMTPESQGRWVMPGDLWRSPSVHLRALLPAGRD